MVQYGLVDPTCKAETEARLSLLRTDAGNEPVRAWLRKLEEGARKQIGEDIGFVQWAWPVGRPTVDGLGGGLYEVRTSHDKNEYRILFCLDGEVMVLLHGYQKKTRKTPPEDIALARKRQKGSGP